MKVRDRIKELRRVPASDLIPNPKNWRTHPPAQADALRGLLAEIGYADALLVRETPEGLMLVDGHLRAETTPDVDVPVLVLDVDEAEADKMLATLDPLAGMAEADPELLANLLATVETESDAVARMLKDLAADNPLPVVGLTDDDAVPEDVEPTTKPGDLWLLGDHRLLCGDATAEADVGRLLGGVAPLLCVTDPPYGVEYDPAWRQEAYEKGLIRFGAKRTGVVANDDRIDWQAAWALIPSDVLYCWHAGRHASAAQTGMETAGFETRCQIIWRKATFVLGRGAYHWQHEPCWYSVRRGANANWIGDRKQTTVWDIDGHIGYRSNGVEDETPHGTQKPLECMARPIRNHDAREVYDPFLGSGTTMIACEKLGRRCYGMEIEPRYVDVATRRWEAYTGQEAVLCPS